MDKLERMKPERKMDEREVRIIEYIKENGSITSSNVQNMFNVTRDTSGRYLNQLIKTGIIKRRARGKATYYTLK